MPPTLSEGQIVAGLVLVAFLAIFGGRARFVRVQRALGLEQLLASSFLFLPVGMLLSEAGLGVIHRAVVREFDALTTLGLGVLGLLLGLRMDPALAGGADRAVVAAGRVEGLFTVGLVALPTWVGLGAFGEIGLAERGAAAVLIGCAAAISSAQSFRAVAGREATESPVVAQVADHGSVAVVLAAGVLLALLSPGSTLAPLEGLLALLAIGTLGGLAAFLLVGDERDDHLRTPLVLGVLLVTAGTAAHLALPPVAATLVAGLTIANLPGNLAAELRNDLGFLEAPLNVVLLVIAGAALRVPSSTSLAMLAVFLLLRTAARILGGRLASAVAPTLPRNVGLGLLPSSAVAVGLALDFHMTARGPLVEVVVTTIVLGSLLSETAGLWTTRLLTRTIAGLAPTPPARPADAPAPELE